MALWRPDPTFYPSPKMAMQAPPEKLAFVALLNPKLKGRPDALAVVDVDAASKSYSQVVGQGEMPNAGDELHHFGWNACSACLSPYAPHVHLERRYLLVPGLRSSQIHISDTKPNPRKPEIVKVIDEQFYPDGVKSWMAKVNTKPEGGFEVDSNFFLEFDKLRSHQVRLEGGDCSSDS